MLQLKLDRMSENDNKSYKALQLMKAEVDNLNKEEPKKVLLCTYERAPHRYDSMEQALATPPNLHTPFAFETNVGEVHAAPAGPRPRDRGDRDRPLHVAPLVRSRSTHH